MPVSRSMNHTSPLADPRLVRLLTSLLAEESLPPVDRWFSSKAKVARWSPSEQKELWDSLRRALTRAYGLVDASAPMTTSWPGFREAIRGRAEEWAIRSQLSLDVVTAVGAGIPGWLAPAFEDRCRRSRWTDEQARAFLCAQETPAPVHVRFRAGDEGARCAQRLSSQGMTGPSDVEGIPCLTGGMGLEKSEDWQRGLVEIQDAASQLTLRRLGLRPGMRVWDVCAGQGGKTLLAAHELRGKGALWATDIVEAKLKVLKERVKRSGWQNIRQLLWDGTTVPSFGPEVGLNGGFDRVIVDAPCSAVGTWRRDPEGRFRLTPRTLEELGKHQHRLIRLGWKAVKPGGRLAYVTCSWLPSEDEEVVETFAAESGATVVHEELLGLPYFDANTMYTAILEKRR